MTSINMDIPLTTTIRNHTKQNYINQLKIFPMYPNTGQPVIINQIHVIAYEYMPAKILTPVYVV